MAFQIGEYRVGQPEATPIVNDFLNVFNVVVSGALIVLIVRMRDRRPFIPL